jgi:hypothetical protein
MNSLLQFADDLDFTEQDPVNRAATCNFQHPLPAPDRLSASASPAAESIRCAAEGMPSLHKASAMFTAALMFLVQVKQCANNAYALALPASGAGKIQLTSQRQFTETLAGRCENRIGQGRCNGWHTRFTDTRRRR